MFTQLVARCYRRPGGDIVFSITGGNQLLFILTML